MKKIYYAIKEFALKFKNIPVLGTILKTTDKKFREITSKKSITIDGFKIFLNKDDPLRLSLFGEFEKGERSILAKLIKKGDTVLDIGANIGFHSLLFSRLVGEKGMVYAFEPFPENFALLKKNIEINNIKNMKPIQKAVSDKEGTERLYVDKYSNASHSFYTPDAKEFMEVETIKLDGFEIKTDFIKIDVEGAERKVLKGMIKLIERNPNLKMMIEFVPHTAKKTGVSTEEFLDTLEKYFKLYEIDKENLIEINKDKLSEKYTIQNCKGTNLFCIN